jgi:lysyl-tRNA synthetase class II
MMTDRAAATNSLKPELGILETDMNEYREIVKSIKPEDIVQIYTVAGRQRWRAEQITAEDLKDLEKSLKELEDKVRAIKADLLYGF